MKKSQLKLCLATEAKSYLLPGSDETERERFVKLLNKYGLFEELFEMIEANPSWQKLAETKGIYFFIDVVHSTEGLGHVTAKIPSISILCLDQGNIPVIKLCCTADS